MAAGRGIFLPSLVRLGLLATMANAHDHDEGNIPEGETVSMDPIDSTLWAHIFVQTFVFGVLFPVGMVLGVSSDMGKGRDGMLTGGIDC